MPAAPIKFCAVVSDPYHAIERRYQLTRRMLTVLRASTAGVLLLTRSALVARDFDILSGITDVWVGVSLPTIDDAARRHFEPRAASVAERLRALAECRRVGVRTFAVVQPILPGPTLALADALAEHAGSVRVDVLHGVAGAEAEFADPRWSVAADAAWQRRQAAALTAALADRGVSLWTGELPPGLDGRATDVAGG